MRKKELRPQAANSENSKRREIRERSDPNKIAKSIEALSLPTPEDVYLKIVHKAKVVGGWEPRVRLLCEYACALKLQAETKGILKAYGASVNHGTGYMGEIFDSQIGKINAEVDRLERIIGLKE